MMSEIIDASSKYQDSLPVSSDDVLAQLDAWGIAYTRADHVPLRTVEDSKKVQDMFLSSEEGGGHIKNLYLRDNKNRNNIIVAEQDRVIDLKALHQKLGDRAIVVWIRGSTDGKFGCAPGCGDASFDDQWGEIECSNLHGC